MSKLKRLIILDLNGLLIHRLYKNDYFKCKRLFEEQYQLDRLTRPEQKGNFAVWFRPHIKSFLNWLMENFHVAIWSSVLQHNIAPIVESLFPEEHERDRLLFWWNQEHLWEAVDVNERWLVNQPSDRELSDNTLLIDDNKLKVRDNPINTSIHPRTWKLFELYDDNHSIRIYEDDLLAENGYLRKWLKDLLKWNGTVIEYVEQHPYIDPPLKEIENKTESSWDSGWD
ncbi:hypothetical protein I4U23_007076 [Adineta vaga]|nr:hypothetical protein I4U23_007076 [Adineta vaga]